MFGTDYARNDIFGLQAFVAKQTFVRRIHVGSVDDFNNVFDPNEWSFFKLVKQAVNDRFTGNEIFTRRRNVRSYKKSELIFCSIF